MDASQAGCGGTLGEDSVGHVGGTLSAHTFSGAHGNPERVLHHFALQLRRKHVMVRSDNTTVVVYLSR